MKSEVIILQSVHARRAAGGRMHYNYCLLMVKVVGCFTGVFTSVDDPKPCALQWPHVMSRQIVF